VAENFQDKAANRTSLVMNRFVVEKYEILAKPDKTEAGQGSELWPAVRI
jgi:hypothetical protein